MTTPIQPVPALNGAPALTPPPETGDVMAPNGHGLYWRMTEQGREWLSDECGGVFSIWHTALVDPNTLLLAIAKEAEFQHLEREIRRRLNAIERQSANSFAVIDDGLETNDWITGPVLYVAPTYMDAKAWADEQMYTNSAIVMIIDGKRYLTHD